MKPSSEQVAFISGGRRGIGRAIVDAFHADGIKVLTCGRGARPDDLPSDVWWQTADVSRVQAAADLQQAVREQFGAISILVNNAGVQIEKTVLETTDEDWDELMNTNARGVFLLCRAFIPLMSAGGRIINIGSISGHVADRGMALYNASKAFVHGLTRSIAVDHGPHIRCNAICPGWIMTEMAETAFDLADNPDAAKQDALARHPAGRFGAPSDIAAMALWLCSEQAAFATGQCFTMDGGLTAASPLNPALF